MNRAWQKLSQAWTRRTVGSGSSRKLVSQAVMIEPGGSSGCQGQFVSGNMVGMRMGDEGPGLPAADVHSQLCVRQKKPIGIVEHLDRVVGL